MNEKQIDNARDLEKVECNEALECLEKLKSLNRKAVVNNKGIVVREETPFEELYSTIEQALTTKSKKELAWDIVKKKDVDIYILNSCKTVEEYNSKIVHIIGETRELTQGEFDLLKEMLNNE